MAKELLQGSVLPDTDFEGSEVPCCESLDNRGVCSTSAILIHVPTEGTSKVDHKIHHNASAQKI